jgi:two-component system nitrate/nitrite response regulator NarL
MGEFDAGSQIRVLVADSSRMASQMLVDTLGRDARLQVLEAPLSSEGFLAAAASFQPNLAIMGLSLNGNVRKGLDLLRAVRNSLPEMRVIILLDPGSDDVMVEAFRAGVDGVICRNDSIDSLIKCVHCVHAGQIWANSQQLRVVLQSLAQQSVPRSVVDASGNALLSKRELDVIRGVAQGMTNREIASHLTLSEHTVKNYLFRVFDKLGVSNRAELLMFVLSNNGYASMITDKTS